eukprot:6205210-Pleurochrysis_carterae.AAC.2
MFGRLRNVGQDRGGIARRAVFGRTVSARSVLPFSRQIGCYGPEALLRNAARRATVRSAAAGAQKSRRHSANRGHDYTGSCATRAAPLTGHVAIHSRASHERTMATPEGERASEKGTHKRGSVRTRGREERARRPASSVGVASGPPAR